MLQTPQDCSARREPTGTTAGAGTAAESARPRPQPGPTPVLPALPHSAPAGWPPTTPYYNYRDIIGLSPDELAQITAVYSAMNARQQANIQNAFSELAVLQARTAKIAVQIGIVSVEKEASGLRTVAGNIAKYVQSFLGRQTAATEFAADAIRANTLERVLPAMQRGAKIV